MNKPVVQFKPKPEAPAVAPAPAPVTAPLATAKKPRKRAWLTLARASVIVAGIGLAVVVPLGWGSWVAGMTNQSTNNAYLQADTTPVSAEVEGRVTRLLVSDFQEVKKGDLLLQIDPTEYQAQVQQAEAAVLAAEAQILNIESQIQLQHRVVDRARAGLAALGADRDRLEAENRRQSALKEQGWTTEQKLEAAVADIKRVDAQIVEQEAAIEAERERINVLSTQAQQANAELSSARAGLDLAMIELDRTKLTAPSDGVVGTSGVREGQFVRAGAQVLSVVPMSELYVTANFRETQLAQFQPGQAVSVRVDTFPGKILTGHVERLSPATGAVFSLLPADNATGNFTKVAQRVAVRIALDADPELAGRLRPGMSVEATVHTDQFVKDQPQLAAVR